MIGGTIFALASGSGRTAVALMRMSGPDVPAILDRLAGGLPEPRVATLRRLRDPSTGEAFDRGLVLWFPPPASYTGEAVAELHLHGGPAVIEAAADALVAAGARPAEPGEFTRRAYANGKVDLLAAEGIADLIGAETSGQLRQALRQAEGALTTLVAGWSGRLVSLLARQEAFIEFETEDLPAALEAEIAAAVAALHGEIAGHLAGSARAERLRSGVDVAILGAPNAGKSTLLNALIGRSAAIVSPTAGTTRDIVEARLSIAGVPVTLADTAGLRATDDPIEQEGVGRAVSRAASADLLLLVFAADTPVDGATLEYLGHPALVVVTKSDLAPPPAAVRFGSAAVCVVSAATGAGLDMLRDRLAGLVAQQAGPALNASLTRPRHRAACAEAANWLARFASDPLPEMRAEALRAALAAIGRLSGRISTDQILDEVFAGFCIGK